MCLTQSGHGCISLQLRMCLVVECVYVCVCVCLTNNQAAVCVIYVHRDAAERDLAAAEKALKQLELAAPKAAQLAAAKREEAADLEARLGQLQVCMNTKDCMCVLVVCLRAAVGVGVGEAVAGHNQLADCVPQKVYQTEESGA